MSNRGLPGGRGYRKGPDAKIDQRESDVIREFQAQKHTGIIYPPKSLDSASNAMTYLFGLGPDMFFMPFLHDVTEVAFVRFFNTAPGVGTFNGALYSFDMKDRIFTMLPGTYFRCSTNVGGINTIALRAPVYLYPSDTTLLAFCGAAFNIGGLTCNAIDFTNDVLNSWGNYAAIAPVVLAGTFPYTAFTWVLGVTRPHIVYLSTLAASFL